MSRDPHARIASYAMTRMELDSRDNVTTCYSSALRKWLVMQGSAMIGQFDDQPEAVGAARRLCEGSE